MRESEPAVSPSPTTSDERPFAAAGLRPPARSDRPGCAGFVVPRGRAAYSSSGQINAAGLCLAIHCRTGAAATTPGRRTVPTTSSNVAINAGPRRVKGIKANATTPDATCKRTRKGNCSIKPCCGRAP